MRIQDNVINTGTGVVRPKEVDPHVPRCQKVAEIAEVPAPSEPPSLSDVRWKGDEFTKEQIAKLAGSR